MRAALWAAQNCYKQELICWTPAAVTRGSMHPPALARAAVPLFYRRGCIAEGVPGAAARREFFNTAAQPLGGAGVRCCEPASRQSCMLAWRVRGPCKRFRGGL
jgi:hypothetical protein